MVQATSHQDILGCPSNKHSIYPSGLYGRNYFVMGAEDKGLEEFWRKSSDLIIKIPMLGHNDSLNVSVSAAVLLYETIRQRS
jgi:TrmH family RNA methyltransferase